MSAESTEKVARPATPNLNLLEALTKQVYLPVGQMKLASGGLMLQGERLTQALTTGANVAAMVQQRYGNRVDEVDAVSQKVAAMMGLGDQSQDAEINASISQDPALAGTFAAALA